MHVEVVAPDELDEDALARWDRLQADDRGLDSPFLGSAFAREVAKVRPDTRVAVVSGGDGPAAFLPFERRRGGRGTALAMGLSDVQGLVAPSDLDLDLSEVLRSAGLRLFRFDHWLAAQEGWLTSLPSRLVLETSPALDLTGGYEAYLAGQQATSKSLLSSTARKRRKLEREHGAVRLVLHEPDHAVLDQVLAWKSDQYRRTGRRDRFADPANRALVHSLLDVSGPSFAARLSVLYAGDAVVAAHLGLRSRTTLAWWFPVYDPAYAAYSPGLVLVLDIARAAVEDGVTLLDLGKGDEPYKDRLSNTGLRLLSGSVAPSRVAQASSTALQWPGDRVMRTVLASPRLRGLSREALARAGAARQRWAGTRS